jgi:hypothetical protein
VADKVHDAGLHRGLREGRGDRLGEAFQTVNDRDQDVLDPAVPEFVHDAEPEFFPFIFCNPFVGETPHRGLS